MIYKNKVKFEKNFQKADCPLSALPPPPRPFGKFPNFFSFFVEDSQSKSPWWWWWWWSGPEPTGEWGGEEEQSQLPALVGDQPSARPGPQVSLCISLFFLFIPIENVCSTPLPGISLFCSIKLFREAIGKKSHVSMDIFRIPLSPPPPGSTDA